MSRTPFELLFRDRCCAARQVAFGESTRGAGDAVGDRGVSIAMIPILALSLVREGVLTGLLMIAVGAFLAAALQWWTGRSRRSESGGAVLRAVIEPDREEVRVSRVGSLEACDGWIAWRGRPGSRAGLDFAGPVRHGRVRWTIGVFSAMRVAVDVEGIGVRTLTVNARKAERRRLVRDLGIGSA
jgi:hypothetical protein